jgi:hypothetical protein
MQPPRGSTQLLPARSRRSGRNAEAEVASRSMIGALWSAAIARIRVMHGCRHVVATASYGAYPG